MKHFMLRSLMLLSLLGSTWGVGSVWAQLRDGGVYYFESAYLTGKSLTSANANRLTSVVTDLSDPQQLWEANEVSTGSGGFTLRNIANGQYMRSTNSDSGQSYWNTVATADANCQFSCTGPDANKTYAMRATNTDHARHFMHAPSADKVIGWEVGSAASRWYIHEVVVYDEAAVPGALSNLFSDAACTTLKKQFANEAALTADIDYLKLPETLRNMAKKVYNQTWTENNYDGTKSAWDSDYAKKYRVQWYEPYTEPECAASALRINAHSNLNNPTGIFANSGDELFVMVEGEIKEGAYLYLAKYTGHNKLGGYKDGVQLQSGLNVIPVTEDGSNYCINYVVQTFDSSKGTGKNAIIEGRELSNYPDLQIHIEGGYINGYWNKMGDNTDHNGDFNYPADTDADWDYIKARATQTDVTVLGEYVTLQFPLTDAGTGDDQGMGTYFNSYNGNTTSLEASIEEWDNVMIWERLLMGVLGKEVIETEDKKSPYSDESKVTAYTGNDGDDFGCDYSKYYRIHGLSFGTEGGYMYGGWDHCGYNFNTMESIMLSIVDEAGPHWGPAHEIGHQHQGPLNMRGLTEVTNNLFSNVVLWYFGETTSRYNGTQGALSNVLAQFNAEGTDFFSNNIWAQTIMYYKLFLYYHVLGHNPKFYPRLFEMLRQNPMAIEYNQDGGKCLMHFYKLCCDAAQEDLTEFFRAHGFFEVMENRFVGDYSNAVYNMTQAQIDAAIAEVKAKPYPENIAVLFVTDATGETILSHKGDNLELYGETQVCAQLGSYANFNNNKASAYTATVSGTTVTMTGEGGVGFAILNKKGELIGFSDKKEFELSLDAVEAILNGEANFVVVNGDASTTPATFEGNADERNKSLLGEMIESVKAFTNYEDATGKKIGYYKSSSLESMKAALEKAQEVYDNEEKTSYTAMFNVLKQEYNAFLAADYNEIPMTAGTFILKNCSNNQHLYVNEEKLALTNTAEANLENTAKWVFEKTGSGKYYIKNLSTEKYIGALAKDDNVPVLNTTGADAYDVVPMGNPGEFAIVYGDKVSFNTSWKGVIGWDYDDRNSWWYITAVETDPADAQAVLLKELLENTQALYDQMAVTPIPEVIPLTESSYFSNALQKGGAYPSDNFTSYSVLCDGDPFTHFHSAYSGTNPNTHHYIRVDLGEEYKSDLFAFTYTNRSSNNRQNPTAITVEGCNEADGTYEHIVSLTTLDGLPTTEASSFESELLGTQGKTYRYLRFKVTETNSNAKFGDYPYFSITELGVLKGSFAITANSKYASNTITDAYMLEVFNALRQAKHDYRNATTADDYKRACDALNIYYETLLNAYTEVKDADISAKKAELETLIDNTTTLIGQCGSVNYIPGTFDGEAPLQTTNVNSGFYLSTNAPEPKEGAIGNLLDADMNSFFHSAWSVDINAEHYLLVDVGEGNELKDFTFSYQSNKIPIPATIKVYGSNDNSDYTWLATFSKTDETNPIPTTTNTKWTSSRIVKDVAYRYLRFNVTESTGTSNISPNPKGEYCFVMSDFDITAYGREASYEVTVKVDDVTADLLLATYKENQEALGTHTYATTYSQLVKAIADLQAQYDALLEAKGKVDKSELASLIETATTRLRECGTVTVTPTPNGDVLNVTLKDEEQAGSVNKNMLRELYRAIKTAEGVRDNANATQEEVNAASETLTSLIGTVETAQQSNNKANLKSEIAEMENLLDACEENPGSASQQLIKDSQAALQTAIDAYNADDTTVDGYTTAKATLNTQYESLSAAKNSSAKSDLAARIKVMQDSINICCKSITKDGDEYTVVWKSETAGDVDKATLIAAYEALVQANAVYNGEASTVSEYQAAKEALNARLTTLNAYQQGDHKAQLKSKVDLLTALIENCKETYGDLTDIMYNDIVQRHATATAYLTQEFATHGELVNAITPAIQYIEDNIEAWNKAQQSTAKADLLEKIKQMQELIDACTTGEGEAIEYVGDVTEDLLNISREAKETAQAVVASPKASTAEFIAATEKLQGHYNTLEAAKNSKAKADLRAMIAQLAELIEKCRIEETGSVRQESACDVSDAESGKNGNEYYLLVDAGEGETLKNFYFSYQTQTDETLFPYEIEVYGSDNNSEFTNLLATFTTNGENALPSTAGASWTSGDINSVSAYRYLRFNVTVVGKSLPVDDGKDLDTSNGGAQLSNKYKNTLTSESTENISGDFSSVMSDFRLIKIVDVEKTYVYYKGDVTENQWNNATTVNNNATTLANGSWDSAELTSTKGNLQVIHDELLEASQQITVNLTEVNEERDKLLTGIYNGQTIGTFSAPWATEIPEGVTAYYAKKAYDGEGGTVWLTPVGSNILPANQGVILIGEVGVDSRKFELTEEVEEVVDLSENVFSNSAKGPVVMEGNDYILAKVDGQGIGFFNAKPGSKLNQRKAFFRLPAGLNTLKLVLKFGGNTTDIDSTMTDTLPTDDVIYDIYGRRVIEVKKGNIYIKNGKKFFVK